MSNDAHKGADTGEPSDNIAVALTWGQLTTIAVVCLVAMVGVAAVAISGIGGATIQELPGADDDDDTDEPPDENGLEADDEDEADDDEDDLLPGADEDRADGDSEAPDDDADTDIDDPQPEPEPAPDNETDDVATDEPDPFFEVVEMTPSLNSGESFEYMIYVWEDSDAAYDGEARLIDEDGEVHDTDTYRVAQTDDLPVITLEYQAPEVDETQEVTLQVETDHGTVGLGDVRINAVDDNGNDDDDGDEWTDEERQGAAEMIAEDYEGYLAGISMATDSGWATERNQIEDGEQVPWPLEVWDDPEEAFEEGMEIGAGEGAEPVEDNYNDHRDDAEAEDEEDDEDDRLE